MASYMGTCDLYTSACQLLWKLNYFVHVESLFALMYTVLLCMLCISVYV